MQESNRPLIVRTAPHSGISRALRPFARVEPDEVVSALVLTATIFLLLTAHYFLKTAREPMILLTGGAEGKAYTAAGQSLLLLGVVPAYSALARRMSRLKLIATVYGFFALNLVLFAVPNTAGRALSVAFYLWVGVFNVSAVALFWSFANDVYEPDQGKRLFAVVGVGSSVGAVVGALLARELASLGPRAMMLGAALILCTCAALIALVHRREKARIPPWSPRARERRVIDGPVLTALLHDRFVLLVALMTLLLNCVNANGEYMLDRALLDRVGTRTGGEASAFVAEFKAEYFAWVNGAGVLLQLFVVARVIARFGVRRTLFVLPLVALAGYGSILGTPVLALILIAKIAENSLDYSLVNTARQSLFLVGDRVEKYIGKAFVDTVVVRLGDVASAGIVALGSVLAVSLRYFAVLNLALIACWLLVLIALGREHKRRSAGADATTIPPDESRPSPLPSRPEPTYR